jgi:predicted dithiol-disulfide oxidoreductase (DUF899 family)
MTLDEVETALAILTEQINAYALGDRPPSPPVRLLREETELRRLRDRLKEEARAVPVD